MSPEMVFGPGTYVAVLDSARREWPFEDTASGDSVICPRCAAQLALPEGLTAGDLLDLVDGHDCGADGS